MSAEISSHRIEKIPGGSDILIFGGGGYVGAAIVHELRSSGISCLSPRSNEVDITNPDSVRASVAEFPGRHIILASAITDVAGIEKDDELYYRAVAVNVDGARNVAEACREAGKKFIYISTGCVRAGDTWSRGPYKPDDPLADERHAEKMLSRYALTKLHGLREVERVLKDRNLAIVFIDYPCGIVSGVGEGHQRDWYLKTLLRNQARGLPAFADQFLTITSIHNIGEVIRIIAEHNLGGRFNIACPGVETPYNILRYLMRKLGENQDKVKRGSILEYQRALEEKGEKLIWPIWGGLDFRVRSRCYEDTSRSSGLRAGKIWWMSRWMARAD